MPRYDPNALMFRRRPDGRTAYRGYVLDAATAREVRRRLDRYTSVYTLLWLAAGFVVSPLVRTVASLLPAWWPAPTLTLFVLIVLAMPSLMEWWRRRWIVPLYAGAEHERTDAPPQ